jgi:hypothetical protein
MHLDNDVSETQACHHQRSGTNTEGKCANSRRDKCDKQEREIQRVEQHHHGLIPSEDDQDAVHPIRNLRDAGDGAPLGFDVVRVRVLAEPRTEVVQLGLGEDDEGGIEIELVVRGCSVGHEQFRGFRGEGVCA